MTVGVVDVLEVVGVDGDDNGRVSDAFEQAHVDLAVEEFGERVESHGDVGVVGEQERD